MGSNEDCASVLEMFIHDSGNLSQEIAHYFEEMNAKDAELQKALQVINSRDGQLQKHVKLNSSLTAHPKEKDFADAIVGSYDRSMALQDQKIALSGKACTLMERQLKRLDIKIRELQNDGQLIDGPTMPSVFNRKPLTEKTIPDLPIPAIGPLQPASNSALNISIPAHRSGAQMSATPPVPRQISQLATATSNMRNSAPATPASAPQTHRSHRESSAGAAEKRRKLNQQGSFSANAPSQPSSLRQSSLGPSVTGAGTPKAGTPTGTSASGARAGSLPRTTGSQASATSTMSAAKKSTLPKHQAISKLLKGKPSKSGSRLSVTGRPRKGVSPSVRSRAAGTSDDEASNLSSVEVSESESHAGTPRPSDHKSGRGRKSNKQKEEEAAALKLSQEAEGEEGEEDDDDKRYCFCNERSYGEMVACENEGCSYEWFHLACVGMKQAPDENVVWYCPVCRQMPQFVGKGSSAGEKVKEEPKDRGRKGK